MKNVLLVLTGTGTPDKAIEYAASTAAKEKARLVALYILEEGLANEVFDTFTDIGFIGDKPSQELSESIMKDYRQRGYEELGRVQIKAMEEGVEFEPLMEQGEFVSKVVEQIGRWDASIAVLVRRKKKGRLFKYFSRSLADEVKQKAAGCEAVIFEEE